VDNSVRRVAQPAGTPLSGVGSAPRAHRLAVRDNEGVTSVELGPRRTLGGVVAIWALAAVIGVVVGVIVPASDRSSWLAVGLGGCLILAFAVQLIRGRSQGFTQRVAASVLGALVVMGIISLGFGLAVVVPG
jgi:acyl-CoA thioesterase